MKAISIIIVNYNGRRFLQRLLESIRNQSFNDYETLFVDNSSVDDSVEYVRDNYSEVKIILSENKGYGHACNLGSKGAKGDYLVFLNEDMYLTEDFLKQMISFKKKLTASNETAIGGISCKLIDFDIDPSKTPKIYGAGLDIFGFPIKGHDSDDTFIISGCPFFISREVFIKIKGFNENIFLYGEDIDLAWRMKIFGYSNFINHEIYIHHYGGGVTGNFGPEKVANNLCSSFIPLFTNYGLLMLVLIAPFYFIYIFVINIIIFIVKKFDFSYNYVIYKKFEQFAKNLKDIYIFRKFVQKNRVKTDSFIFKYISLVPAFILNNSLEKLNKNYVIKN